MFLELIIKLLFFSNYKGSVSNGSAFFNDTAAFVLYDQICAIC
jgi:hypothetical protein